MLRLTLRDILWRARRVVVGIAATACVFAITLLLQAVHVSFLDETTRTVSLFGADTWLVPAGTAGPFTTNSPVAVRLADQVTGDAEDVTPIAIFRHVVEGVPGSRWTDVNVIAYEPGGVVIPEPVAGRAPTRVGEALADETVGVPVGHMLTMVGVRLEIVGLVRGVTYNGGTPTVLMTLRQGQQIAYGGEQLASAFVSRGTPGLDGAALAPMSPTEVRDDLRRPLEVATGTLGILSALLWVVAAAIVAFVCYLSALDRARDTAVLKAIGIPLWRLAAGVLVEGLVVSTLAAGTAVAVAAMLVPAFPLTISLELSAILRLGAVSLTLAALASIAGIAHVMRVDPALAFATR